MLSNLDDFCHLAWILRQPGGQQRQEEEGRENLLNVLVHLATQMRRQWQLLLQQQWAALGHTAQWQQPTALGRWRWGSSCCSSIDSGRRWGTRSSGSSTWRRWQAALGQQLPVLAPGEQHWHRVQLPPLQQQRASALSSDAEDAKRRRHRSKTQRFRSLLETQPSGQGFPILSIVELVATAEGVHTVADWELGIQGVVLPSTPQLWAFERARANALGLLRALPRCACVPAAAHKVRAACPAL